MTTGFGGVEGAKQVIVFLIINCGCRIKARQRSIARQMYYKLGLHPMDSTVTN